MTESEAKKLREGDKILVAITVKDVQQLTQTVLVRAKGPSGDCYSFSPEEVHGVLPRPLEVGDRVKTDESSPMIVLALDGAYAWLRWEEADGPEASRMTLHLSKLERVND